MPNSNSPSNLLKAFGLLAMLLLAIAAANEVYLRVVLTNMELALVDRQFDTASHDMRICIMGDSHANQAFDPALIQGAFTYTSSDENYIETYYKLQGILEKGIKPNVIILQIDPTTFVHKKLRKLGTDVWYWKQYLNYPALAFELHNPTILRDWLVGEIYFLGQNIKIPTRHWAQNEATIKLGKELNRETVDFSKISPERQAFAIEKYTHDLGNHDGLLQPVLVEYFTKTLQLAAANHITVILVKYPLNPQYLKRVKKKYDLPSFYTALQYIIDSYPDMHVLDYQEFFKDDVFFYDPVHVNQKAAAILSGQLIAYLKERKLY